jgi:hypothetical protein
MLKIVTVDSPDQRKLVVQGRLVEPWVGELQRTWEEGREDFKGRKLMIDLKEVTALNQHAENILMDMMRHGAQLVAGAMITRNVLQHLERRRMEEKAAENHSASKRKEA